MVVEPQDRVEAEELGVNASEEEIGITHVMAISFRRTVIVIVEDREGLCGIGISTAWPWLRFNPLIGRAKARQHALRHIGVARDKAANARASSLRYAAAE